MARPSSLSHLPLGDIQRELQRRQRGGQALQRKRARLSKQLTALDARISGLGLSASVRGNGPVSGRRRPRNEMSLVESLGKVLHGKTLGVSEAADAVQKAGYKTTSANFRTMVNIALINGKFKRVARGQYTGK